MVAHLTQKEWHETEARTRDSFVKEIGKRPTRRSVAKELYNPYGISSLEWLGLLIALFIGVHTAFKMVSVAIPFAQSFYPDDSGVWLMVFVVATSASFVLMSTSFLIYGKIMDESSDEIVKQKNKHPKLLFYGGWKGSLGFAGIVLTIVYYIMGLTPEIATGVTIVAWLVSWYFGGIPSNLLQYIAPRLFGWLTYGILLWLIAVSSHGVGSVFAQYLIVFVELALAYLVSTVIEKRTLWSKAVNTAWEEHIKPYDERMENMRTDPTYLEIQYRELRETMLNLRRKGSNGLTIRPNYDFFMSAGATEAEQVILTEYRRHTSGLRFASMVRKQDDVVHTNVKKAEVVAVGDSEVATDEPTNGRVPPNGHRVWDVATLRNDFIARGLRTSDIYKESNCNADYKSGHAARRAWRDGARLYFTCNVD